MGCARYAAREGLGLGLNLGSPWQLSRDRRAQIYGIHL